MTVCVMIEIMKKRLFIAIKEDSFRRKFGRLLKKLKEKFRALPNHPLVKGKREQSALERGKKGRLALVKRERINWVKAENLHLTLSFLGNVPEKRIKVLKRILKDFSKGVAPFEILFERIDFIRNRGRPRVIYVGLSTDHILPRMILDLNRVLKKEKFKPKSHVRGVHLTLGRVKYLDRAFSYRLAMLARTATSLIPKDSFRIKKIKLVESKMKRSGVEYKIIESCYLTKNSNGRY